LSIEEVLREREGGEGEKEGMVRKGEREREREGHR
jgi:hypothetical protein